MMEAMEEEYINMDNNCTGLKNVHSFTEYSNDNKKVTLSVLHTNIRSLQKNWDEFLIEIDDSVENIDMLILTEVNIKSDYIDRYKLKGFERTEKLRKNRSGGGVVIFTRREIIIEALEEIGGEMEMLIELKKEIGKE